MHFIKTESGQAINTAAIARLLATASPNGKFTMVQADLLNGNTAVLATFNPAESTTEAHERADAQAQRVLDAVMERLLVVHRIIDMNTVRAEAIEAVSV